MRFSLSEVKKAWARAGGNADGSGHAYCECSRTSHDGHVGKYVCNKRLAWNNRGRGATDHWEANHRKAVVDGGSDLYGNCEVLCWECHKAVTAAQAKKRSSRKN
jgi:5-methylcytosine-specific restriction endonuclease McrA